MQFKSSLIKQIGETTENINSMEISEEKVNGDNSDKDVRFCVRSDDDVRYVEDWDNEDFKHVRHFFYLTFFCKIVKY